MTSVREDLMPIGRFAQACRLSVKALRHYDALDLLAPALVDPDTGYRYYGRDQVRPAVTIALLRSLDVPLPGCESCSRQNETAPRWDRSTPPGAALGSSGSSARALDDVG